MGEIWECFIWEVGLELGFKGDWDWFRWSLGWVRFVEGERFCGIRFGGGGLGRVRV